MICEFNWATARKSNDSNRCSGDSERQRLYKDNVGFM